MVDTERVTTREGKDTGLSEDNRGLYSMAIMFRIQVSMNFFADCSDVYHPIQGHLCSMIVFVDRKAVIPVARPPNTITTVLP